MMNENEFNLDFDFEKEYGIDLPKDEPLPEVDDDFDLSAILGPDFNSDTIQFGAEYTTDFDYGPDPDEGIGEDPLAMDIPESQFEEPIPVDLPPEEPPVSEEPEPRAVPERRRKPMSKMRRFKNELLPLIILGVSTLLCLIFIIGSVGRAITTARLEKEAEISASESQVSEAQRLEAEAQSLLSKAAAMAAGYDYEGAINLLNSFSGDATKFPDIDARKSEYAMAQSQLVAHNDPSEVVNLSFHVLIADPQRAFKDDEYGGKYNKNFVTIDEFHQILIQLYENDFVLVDMDSFIAETATGDSVTYETKTLYLPDGKKPVMITETLVNYFRYMVDGNGDGEPDAGGGGFASRLVLDGNGDVKAELVNADGTTTVGNYDLVPILNAFIEDHPDFSYQGARATLAVCGYDGIFGYRTNKDVISTKGQDYYNNQVAGAQEVVEALRADGYEIACYSYENIGYDNINADSIKADINKWNDEVESIIGNVDTLVYAQGSDISTTGSYSGSKYTVLYDEGFRYFITSGTSPSTNVAGDYVRQVRLMVTGTLMANSASTYSSYFDAKSLLNSNRGNVPQ